MAAQFNGNALLAEYGDESLVAELAQLFLESASSQMDAILGAVERNDAEALRAAAHRLRGAVATFGADSAAQWSYALESMATDGDLRGARDLASRLQVDMRSLCDGASAWVAGHIAA
ncbi:MAG: Hpt domain-containing protein [Vicinamibacterales bacterium]